MKRFPLFLFLLLCSCVTSKKVKDYLAKEEKQPEAKAIVAEWLEEHQAWYAEKAAQDFPAKPPAPLPLTPQKKVSPETPSSALITSDTANSKEATKSKPMRQFYTPRAVPPAVQKLPQTNPAQAQALQESKQKLATARAQLQNEKAVHKATRQQLKRMEAERDYWEEKNRKKFWVLVAMGIFTVLYIVFRQLADRVREA